MMDFNVGTPTQASRERRPFDQDIHRALAHWNHRRLQPAAPHDMWEEDLDEEGRLRLVEGRWVEQLRREIRTRAAAAPTDVEGFTRWFTDLESSGPGQHDPLFGWLAEEATAQEMNWFLTQEAAGEAGFDDLVAMAQVKLPDEAKLELARNYWDEMGRGNEGGMHGPMLERTCAGLGLAPTIDGTAWQSLSLANTMTAFATTRRYVWQSIGALGVVELTAPTRVACVDAGLKRVGVPAEARKYFALHAQLDIEHSKAWNAEALVPLVSEDPTRARYIAEGAIMRLICGEQCFEAYRAHLWAHHHPLVYAAE